jgi:flagellar hook-basal body protein
MDVTADNVAHLRTPGYRAARAISAETPGGGSAVTEISRSNASGPIEFTGRPTDVAAGGGFFQVRLSNGTLGYTRDGHFGLNADGYMVTSDGAVL